MQTTKQAAKLRTPAKDYETILQQVISRVSGFGQLYKDLERAINVSGTSKRPLDLRYPAISNKNRLILKPAPVAANPITPPTNYRRFRPTLASSLALQARRSLIC